MTKKLSISEQCRRAGIDRTTYYDRLKRGETDLFAPTRSCKQFVPDHITQLLKEKGISRSTYFKRLEKGWSEFEASNVVPYAEVYKINGKTVRSQLGKNKYQAFLKLVNHKGMSVEEAFENVDKLVGNVKYYRDGMTLYSYCKKYGLSYDTEYAKLKHSSK